MIKEFPHPEGRLKNREIESDRPGTSKAEGAANFPMHGMSNKDHAIIGEMQRFTRVLCNELETGRKQGDFSRLILVAEPRLLGRSKINLELRRMRKGRHFFLQSLDSSLHLKPI